MNTLARPYAFPSLLDGATQTFAVIGTGLSQPDGPTAGTLIKNGVTPAERKLDLTPSTLDRADGNFLYAWAEHALAELATRGMADDVARLELAKALGLLDAPEWFGDTGLPLRGNTPRHRALARLVLEGCFSGFYCLNWDAWVDRALESVGLTEIRKPGDKPPSKRPWNLTAYARLVHGEHHAKAASNRVFRLYKPHGCVVELREKGATDLVFKITKTDLQTQTPERQAFIDGGVNALAGGRPVLGIGWRAAEPYLQQAITRTGPAATEDTFILVARSWCEGHEPIAQRRNTDKTKAHAKISSDDDGLPTLDRLFPWLFARFALRKLEQALEQSPTDKHAVACLIQQLEGDLPVIAKLPHSLIYYCDDWLPAWVRLCWQVGAMRGSDPAKGPIQPPQIPLGPPDLHIPLSGMNLPRLDLEAAARLLVALENCPHYDYSRFPGALWNREKHHLILPLPTWGDLAHFNDLAGLKNLFTALRQHGLGAVQKISLLALAPADTPPLNPAARNKLAALAAKRMPHAAYARSENLGWLELKDLKGDSHA